MDTSSETNEPHPDPQEPAFFTAIRRLDLVRSDDRWIAGVCGGVARRLDIDPLIVRGLTAVLIMLGGIGFIAYGVAWALLPDERDQNIHLERATRGNLDLALLGAAGLIVVGFARGDHWLWRDDVPGPVQFLGWVIVIGAAILVATRLRRTPSTPADPSPYGPFPPPRTDWKQPMSTETPTAWKGTNPTPKPGASNQGPGRTTSGVVGALLLLTMAGVLLAKRLVPVDGQWVLAWAGISLVIIGAAIAIGGVRGRTPGWLGGIAIVGLLLSVPSGLSGEWRAEIHASEATNTVVLSDVATAEKGVDLGVGETVVDLRQLDPDGETVVVPIEVGAGSIDVLLPPDVAVRADVSLGVGTVTWDVDGQEQSADGFGQDRSFSAPGRGGTVALEVDLGAGELHITQEKN